MLVQQNNIEYATEAQICVFLYAIKSNAPNLERIHISFVANFFEEIILLLLCRNIALTCRYKELDLFVIEHFSNLDTENA